MRYCDLHTYSSATCGTASPAQVAQAAHQAGLAAVALTDRETTEGHSECAAACRELGIEFVPGIELPAECQVLDVPASVPPDGPLHILGLFVQCSDGLLRIHCEMQRDSQMTRFQRMIDALKVSGILIDMGEVLAVSNRSFVSRESLAEVLLRRGFVASREEAFDRFIGHGCPAFVRAMYPCAGRCIRAIHAEDGVAVLANPGRLGSDLEGIGRGLQYLAECGLDGVQVLHPDHTPEFSGVVAWLATKYGLLVSGGSGYDGGSPRAMGSQQVPFVHLDSLRAKAVASVPRTLGERLAKSYDCAEEYGTWSMGDTVRRVGERLRARGIDPKTRLPIGETPESRP